MSGHLLIALLSAGLLASPDEAREARPGDETPSFIEKAEELIRDHYFSAKSTAHYEIRSDDPRLEVAAVAELLESFRAFFEEFWADKRPLAPREEPVRVSLFYSRAKLNKLLPMAPPKDGLERVGHYVLSHDVIALHTDTVGLVDLPDVLVHEAAHHLIQQRLLTDRFPPLWLSEGLATYFGNTYRDSKGVWKVGSIGGKGSSLFRGVEGRSGEALARRELKSLQRSLSRKQCPGPDSILKIEDPEFFYGEDVQAHYGTGWILVHFLLHSGGGQHQPGFLKYMQAASGDEEAPHQAFYRTTGLSASHLDAGFLEYAKRLRAH